MSSAAAGAQVQERRETLRDLTRRWFLYFSTFRLLETKPGIGEVGNQLGAQLADMERRARAHPALEERYRHVEHALVYFADEILLNSSWQDERPWQAALLEYQRFKSGFGGADFFTRLQSAQARGDREVLEVFYRCLALGFRGKYAEQPLQLAELRQRLLGQIEPEPMKSERLCPRAYEGIDARPFVRFPKVELARIVLVAGFALLVVYGGALFWLKNQKNSIEAAARAPGAGQATAGAPLSGK